jgi:hypothetical protein
MPELALKILMDQNVHAAALNWLRSSVYRPPKHICSKRSSLNVVGRNRCPRKRMAPLLTGLSSL